MSEIYLDSEESSFDAQNLVDDFAPYLDRDQDYSDDQGYDDNGTSYDGSSHDDQELVDNSGSFSGRDEIENEDQIESEEVEPVGSGTGRRRQREREVDPVKSSSGRRREREVEPARTRTRRRRDEHDDESEEVEPARTRTRRRRDEHDDESEEVDPVRTRPRQQAGSTRTSTTQGRRRQQTTRSSVIPAENYDINRDNWRYQSEFFVGDIPTLYDRIGTSGSLYYASLNNKGKYVKSQVLMAAYSTSPSTFKSAFNDLIGRSYNSDWLGRVAEGVRDAIEAEFKRQFDHCTIRYSTGEQARPSPWTCKDTVLVFFPPEPMMVKLYDSAAKDAERKRAGSSVGNKFDWYPPTTIPSTSNKYRDSMNVVYPGSILYTNDNLKIQVMTSKDPYCIFQFS